MSTIQFQGKEGAEVKELALQFVENRQGESPISDSSTPKSDQAIEIADLALKDDTINITTNQAIAKDSHDSTTKDGCECTC